jgi:hypothetical protein
MDFPMTTLSRPALILSLALTGLYFAPTVASAGPDASSSGETAPTVLTTPQAGVMAATALNELSAFDPNTCPIGVEIVDDILACVGAPVQSVPTVVQNAQPAPTTPMAK